MKKKPHLLHWSGYTSFTNYYYTWGVLSQRSNCILSWATESLVYTKNTKQIFRYRNPNIFTFTTLIKKPLYLLHSLGFLIIFFFVKWLDWFICTMLYKMISIDFFYQTTIYFLGGSFSLNSTEPMWRPPVQLRLSNDCDDSEPTTSSDVRKMFDCPEIVVT